MSYNQNMDKGIGFNRNIKLDWLDATAAFCAETDDPAEIRVRLRPIVRQSIDSQTNIRKSIDILLNIWLRSGEIAPALQAKAVAYYRETAVPADRLWLHYGLTLVTYPFFFNTTTIIGQSIRYEDAITTPLVRKRLMAAMGELGSLEAAVSRIIYSLRDWGILLETGERNTYVPRYRGFNASTLELEAWLLACVLKAHPGEELPFPDLVNHPALFPFHFTTTAGQLRDHAAFAIHRQGLGLDMVRLGIGD